MDITTKDGITMFEHVGGEKFFFDLIDDFYQGVENDPVIRPMYPEDLEPGKRALALFLIQYWGGPTTYSETKGHPRLRMRHINFKIDEQAALHWLNNMLVALGKAKVGEEPLDIESVQQFAEYFGVAARHLINHIPE